MSRLDLLRVGTEILWHVTGLHGLEEGNEIGTSGFLLELEAFEKEMGESLYTTTLYELRKLLQHDCLVISVVSLMRVKLLAEK
jgi:hypothetical protein